MKFVVAGAAEVPQSAVFCCYLIRDPWDDWFAFDTRYQLTVFDQYGRRNVIGQLKIGQANLMPGGERKLDPPERAPVIPPIFEALNENFFSVGQGDDYYESLNALGAELRREILISLRDCAQNLNIFLKYENEPVMQTSLLRYITVENLKNRFHRLATGNAALTRYNFEYYLPAIEGAPSPKMSFLVEPNSEPPTNVHVLIGRNGVGKSRCIQSLTATVLELTDPLAVPKGSLQKIGDNAGNWSFSGLVHVSFSAFDSFAFPSTQTQQKIRGTFVGLSDLAWPTGGTSANLKELLANQFVLSFDLCRSGLRAQRWKTAVQALCSDPMFEEANVLELLNIPDGDWKAHAFWLFKRLSSGHAIVLLTTTRLVELVDERTLVVLDEPEGHLHPPLLSAFIRAISNLLVERNGVAIIATHSPVVLQEVPASCVSILNRSGAYSEISSPDLETFGESVGTLTREVFGLEVTNSGFHALIRQQVKNGLSFDEILAHFRTQLGSEAQILARSLVATRHGGPGKSK